MVDGYEGVYTLDEVTVEFKQVHVIYRGDDFVICTGNPNPNEETAETEPPETDENGEPLESKLKVPGWIRQNDIIIVNGNGLESGKLID